MHGLGVCASGFWAALSGFGVVHVGLQGSSSGVKASEVLGSRVPLVSLAEGYEARNLKRLYYTSSLEPRSTTKTS